MIKDYDFIDYVQPSPTLNDSQRIDRIRENMNSLLVSINKQNSPCFNIVQSSLDSIAYNFTGELTADQRRNEEILNDITDILAGTFSLVSLRNACLLYELMGNKSVISAQTRTLARYLIIDKRIELLAQPLSQTRTANKNIAGLKIAQLKAFFSLTLTKDKSKFGTTKYADVEQAISDALAYGVKPSDQVEVEEQFLGEEASDRIRAGISHDSALYLSLIFPEKELAAVLQHLDMKLCVKTVVDPHTNQVSMEYSLEHDNERKVVVSRSRHRQDITVEVFFEGNKHPRINSILNDYYQIAHYIAYFLTVEWCEEKSVNFRDDYNKWCQSHELEIAIDDRDACEYVENYRF